MNIQDFGRNSFITHTTGLIERVKRMTLNLREQAEQMAKNEYCDGCKGQPLLKYDTVCTETCEGFKADVEQTLREWATEDEAREDSDE